LIKIGLAIHTTPSDTASIAREN
jgi:hypothetical protein